MTGNSLPVADHDEHQAGAVMTGYWPPLAAFTGRRSVAVMQEAATAT